MTTVDDDEVSRLAIEAATRLYTDPTILRFEPKLELEIFGKNHGWQGDLLGPGRGRSRWQVSFPGQRGDWALSKSGLMYLRDALAAGKIQAATVVLKAGVKVINAKSIKYVWPKVEHAYWMDLGSGEFTWVNSTFDPT